ncbi:MAG: hypothetical protein ABJA90_04430, partial [Ginsengibacter sp.]
ARNVQRHVNNVLKNAEKWQYNQLQKAGNMPAFLFQNFLSLAGISYKPFAKLKEAVDVWCLC